MWVSVPYETAYSLSSLNSQTLSLIILQTCTPAYTREWEAGHIAYANYPVTMRKKIFLLQRWKPTLPLFLQGEESKSLGLQQGNLLFV